MSFPLISALLRRRWSLAWRILIAYLFRMPTLLLLAGGWFSIFYQISSYTYERVEERIMGAILLSVSVPLLALVALVIAAIILSTVLSFLYGIWVIGEDRLKSAVLDIEGKVEPDTDEEEEQDPFARYISELFEKDSDS